jgi:hypothetical protein
MRISRTIPMFASAILILAAGAMPAPVLDQVEEDWQVVIASPDVEGIGPQITTCMSPVADGSTPFVAFDLNYREYPTFRPGGMQIQVWSAAQIVDSADQGTAVLATMGETITWTQRMSVSGGMVSYQVNNGQSTTWGKFGQGNAMLNVGFNSAATSMAGYSPDTSVAKSGVTWESNLVTSMTLLQVRYYSNGQLISTDTTPRPITLDD